MVRRELWHARRVLRIALAVALAGTLACERAEPSPPASPQVVAREEMTWLKGQVHMHTGNSGDSETPVPGALRWYEGHGFDFAVVTDHNFVTAPPRMERLVAAAGIELTQNLEQCEPMPAPGQLCLLHVNALFVDPGRAGRFAFPPASSTRRVDLFARALAATRELGGIAVLNHPNFHYAADAELLVALAKEGLVLFELANAAIDSNNEGDADHPSTEQLWDVALGRGARLFAVATDDAHHYDDAPAVTARGETAYTGDRGFVMVQATREPAAIRAAMLRGDFYASTGPVLRSLRRGPEALEIETTAPHTIELIGEGGAVLRTVQGTRARIALDEVQGSYVRGRVRDAEGRAAWTQPLWK
jgi:hypothetical protein